MITWLHALAYLMPGATVGAMVLALRGMERRARELTPAGKALEPRWARRLARLAMIVLVIAAVALTVLAIALIVVLRSAG